MRQLRARLIALQPQVIILPTPGPWGLFGARFARTVGAGVIVGFHTPFDQIIGLYNRRLVGGIASFGLRRINRYLFRRSAIVLGNSQTMVDEARALGASTVKLIGTPLARSFLDCAPGARVLRHIGHQKNVVSSIYRKSGGCHS